MNISEIVLMCNCILLAFLLTFFHNAVCFLASSESVAGGIPNCKAKELYTSIPDSDIENTQNIITFGPEGQTF